MFERTLTKSEPHVLHSDWIMSPVVVLEFVHGDPPEAAVTTVTLLELLPTCVLPKTAVVDEVSLLLLALTWIVG